MSIILLKVDTCGLCSKCKGHNYPLFDSITFYSRIPHLFLSLYKQMYVLFHTKGPTESWPYCSSNNKNHNISLLPHSLLAPHHCSHDFESRQETCKQFKKKKHQQTMQADWQTDGRTYRNEMMFTSCDKVNITMSHTYRHIRICTYALTSSIK